MGLKVTIDVFSGRENPVVILDNREASQFLKKMKRGKKSKLTSRNAPPSTLGYRGLIVEQTGSVIASFPKKFRLAADSLYGSSSRISTEGIRGAEEYVFDKLSKVKNVKLERSFKKRFIYEVDRFYELNERLKLIKIKWPLFPVCKCAPIYEPDWWNNNPQIKGNNNCYNYACNYRTDTFAQPGRATGNMYTSLSGCAVPAPGRSALDGAVSDALINTPTANNKCPSKGHLVALVIAPDWDFHWYRKGTNGLWSHKPGSTSVTNKDNSNKLIADPRTADRGPYTQFCTFMNVMHGHIKIN